MCKSGLNCGPIRVAVICAEMRADWELAVQCDGCVCWRILTSSFHDWLDIIEEMMKGATVHTISYIMSSSHTLARSLYISDSLCLYFISPHKLAYLPANAVSRSSVSDGQLMIDVWRHWLVEREDADGLERVPVQLEELCKGAEWPLTFERRKTPKAGMMMDLDERKWLRYGFDFVWPLLPWRITMGKKWFR